MIRLFAPPTPDRVLHADLVTVLSLALHAAVLTAILVPERPPPGQPSAIERFVVFLVPPDRPAGQKAAGGDIPWGAAAEAAKGAEVQSDAPVESAVDEIAARGEVPLLDAAALNAAARAMHGGETFSVLEVDSAVVRDPTSAAPQYPEHLRTQGIEGSAFVRYVVDTLGLVDTLSYRVVRATHADFAVAVRLALPHMRFRPALQGARKVRQLVEQNFSFRIVRRDTVVTQVPLARRPRPRDSTPGGAG